MPATTRDAARSSGAVRLGEGGKVVERETSSRFPARGVRIRSPASPTEHTTSSPATGTSTTRPEPTSSEGGLSDHSRFGSDLDGGTADAADVEQPAFPPRDRDEEDGELPELPHPRLLRDVLATRARSGLPRAEVLLFRAKAEDEEHRSIVGRRAVPPAVGAPPPGGRHAPGRDAVEHPVNVIPTRVACPVGRCAECIGEMDCGIHRSTRPGRPM